MHDRCPWNCLTHARMHTPHTHTLTKLSLALLLSCVSVTAQSMSVLNINKTWVPRRKLWVHGEDPRLLQESCSASRLCREVVRTMKPAPLSVLGGGRVLSSTYFLLLSHPLSPCRYPADGKLGGEAPQDVEVLAGFSEPPGFYLRSPTSTGETHKA